MTVLITLTTAGSDTGPFDLYSNLDGFVSAFETGVSRSALLVGYTSNLVPNGTTTIRVKSNGRCKNYIDIVISGTTTTTTTSTTSSTTTSSTTTSSTTSTTTTEAPPSCTEYYNNTSGDITGVDYTTCGGVQLTNQTVPSNQSICAQDGTVSGGGSGFLIPIGPC